MMIELWDRLVDYLHRSQLCFRTSALNDNNTASSMKIDQEEVVAMTSRYPSVKACESSDQCEDASNESYDPITLETLSQNTVKKSSKLHQTKFATLTLLWHVSF